MKYWMPFLLPSSCCSKVAVACFPGRPLFGNMALPSPSDSLNRKSNCTPIILPCQILNSVGGAGGESGA